MKGLWTLPNFITLVRLATLPFFLLSIAEGRFERLDELRRCIGPSRLKTPGWRDELLTAIADAHVNDSEPFIRETDPSDDMEGLVVKLEENGVVVERAKLVRDTFKSPGHQTSSQWLAARRVKNRLAAQ